MKKINYFFFLLFSLFLLNCRQPRQPRDPAAFYESKTKTCIDKGMLSLACHNINKYSYMLPTKTDSLLQKMIKREKEFLKYYRDQKNIKKMFFHIRNLMALGVYTHTKFTNYERKIAGAFRGVEDAYYKYLSIKHKIPGWQETVKPTRNREYYKSILVKINIDIIYESQSTGLKRDFHKMGSGFFINKNMILTAFHVVENFYDSDNITKELKITTADGKIINGTLHACDPLLDLALIKTDKPADIKNMIPTYQLCGDSSSVKPGENVYCFGHHLGLKYTLTRGIISGRNRRAPEYATWLQVDAALSGGASGGLLIGEDGHIYGMIVAGMIYEDVNFVVPSQLILSALDRLKQGHISRGWLGMSVYTEPYKKSKVRVKGFYDCSPLYNTEINYGARLLKVNNVPVTSIAQAQKLLLNCQVGNIIKLTVNNNYNEKKEEPALKQRDFYCVLENRPEKPPYYLELNNFTNRMFLSYGFKTGREDIRKNFEYDKKKQKAPFRKVTFIHKDSYLDRMGVVKDDYICILANYFNNKNHYMTVLHFPNLAKRKNNKIEREFNRNIKNFIYTLKRTPYAPNTL